MMPASNPLPAREQRKGPAFLFDLDGTLVDSVYQHVMAWREALETANIELSVWRIHRRIGMSGGLFVNALAREMEKPLPAEEAARLGVDIENSYARFVVSYGSLTIGGPVMKLNLLGKLLLAFAIVLAFLVVVGAVGIYPASQINGRGTKIYDEDLVGTGEVP